MIGSDTVGFDRQESKFRTNLLPLSSTLNFAMAVYSEKLVLFHQATRRHLP